MLLLLHFCIAQAVNIQNTRWRVIITKILIIDTDKASQKKLSRIVSGISVDTEIVMFSDIEEFSALGSKAGLDIAFLETEIGGYSGIALASDIKRYSPNCNIIFVTSFPQHSLEAFKARPSGFVVKPFDEKDIRLELEDLRYPVNNAAYKKGKLRVVTFGGFAEI